MHVGIVGQRGNDRASSLAGAIVEAIEDEATVRVDEETAAVTGLTGTPIGRMDDCDLVVSIGGDGTFLFVVRETGGPPILGVNLGEVGFLNAVAPDDAIEAVERAVAELREDGSVSGRRVNRLVARGEGWTLDPALNEVIVHGPRRGHGGGIEVDVRVDGDSYVASHVDGVIVATPTGSTAYNLSERGPLVHPGVDAMVVNQMAATEAMPPLVVDGDATIELHLAGKERAYAISDGRTMAELTPPATVTVERADEPITIAGPEASFFDALDKLE